VEAPLTPYAPPKAKIARDLPPIKWARNWTALAICVAVFVGLQVFAEWAQPFQNTRWEVSTAVVGLVLIVLGGGLVFAFRGGFWTQALFVVAIPVLAQLALQLTWGSDPAYPGLTLLLAVPYGALFFLGAVFIGGPLFLWRQSRNQHPLQEEQ
jgi:hypothetical protein